MYGNKRITRRRFLRLSGAGIAGAGLVGIYGCGGGSSGGTPVDWASWANPGEAERFQEYTDRFNKNHPKIELKFTPTPNFDEYHPKILTQLNGGTAPDAFYTGDTFIAQFIKNETIRPLDSLMRSPDSKAQPGEFFQGLWGAARTPDGAIYGITVDCNPVVIWFNKKVLQEAKISDSPIDLYERGEWKWDVFQDMASKMAKLGKTNGFMLENGNAWFYTWVYNNGGRVYENGRFVANEDSKSIEAFQFLYDNLRNENFAYAGTLPTGQGSDAQFMAGQAGFISAGRWLLPVFKQNESLEYDVVPFPANTDNQIEPSWVATAYLVMNKNTGAPDKTFTFMTDFTSPEGQRFRLETAGNAVPSVSGADEVVLQEGILDGAKYFLDVRETGWAMFATETRVPGLTEDMQNVLEKRLWLPDGDGDVQGALDEVANIANTRIQQSG